MTDSTDTTQSTPSNQTTETPEVQAAKAEAVDNVVERVQSWQEGAETEVIADELVKGFDEAQVEVDRSDVEALAGDIHDGDEPDTSAVTPQ